MVSALVLRHIIGSSWIAAVLACGETPTATLPICPPDPFAAVVPADTGWRALIQAQAASVPADTLLEVIVAYQDSVTDADRAVLEAAGAIDLSELLGMPAVAFRLSAREVLLLTAQGGSLADARVETVEVGRRVCIASARASP